jgi:hypothetical protein
VELIASSWLWVRARGAAVGCWTEGDLEWVLDMICDAVLAEVGEVVVACI